MITLDREEQSRRNRGPQKLYKVHRGPYNTESGDTHPMIRFGGRYLEALGFQIGDIIEVGLEPCRITITKLFQRN
jgi:hypothetical protein